MGPAEPALHATHLGGPRQCRGSRPCPTRGPTDVTGENEMSDASAQREAIHPAARMYADEHRAGKLSRREFLSRSTALGVSAAAAYGLIGMARPAEAQTAKAQGGTLR